MSALAIIAALLLEQWRGSRLPVRWTVRADLLAAHWAQGLDGGRAWHAWLAWTTITLGVAIAAGIAGYLLGLVNGLLRAAWVIGILCLCIGVRDLRLRYLAVRNALQLRRLDLAGAALADWTGAPLVPVGSALPASTPETIASQAIERALMMCTHQLFGVLFWFALLPGASGALLYRTAQWLATRWGAPDLASAHPGFAAVAGQAMQWLDQLPCRLAAGTFALAGDFTGATEGWQGAARERASAPRVAMVAAALGALGRPTMAAVMPGQPAADHFDGAGWDADSYALAIAQMDRASALVWRSLLLWLAVFVLAGAVL